MTDLTKQVLKVARRDPEFRRALRAELLRQAAPTISDDRFWEITKALKQVYDVRAVLFDAIENERELTAYAQKYLQLAEALAEAVRKNKPSLTLQELQDLDYKRYDHFMNTIFLADIVRRGKDVYEKSLESIPEILKSFAAIPPSDKVAANIFSRGLIQAYADYLVAKNDISTRANEIVGVFGESWKVMMDSLKAKIAIIENNGAEVEKFLAAWAAQNMKGVRAGGTALPANLAEMKVSLEDLSKLIGSIQAMQRTLDRQTLGMLRNYVGRTANVK